MPNETAEIKRKTRRVKDHVLNKFLLYVDKLEEAQELSDYEKSLYKEMMLTFARNVLPRTQEITGEDGGALQVSLVKYADNITTPIPTETIPTTTPESV